LAQQGLQDLLADREAERNKASSAFSCEPYLLRARKPVVRPKAKPKRENKNQKELKDAVKAEELETVSAPSNKASSAFCREPYLLRARKPVVRPKAKPKRENKNQKELKDAVKAEELETVNAPSSYPQYVGDTSDDEDELPLCLLELLGSGEEGDQVPTKPNNITKHLSSSPKSQLKDDVPAQIKQAFRISHERRWATGVLRFKQVDTSRDLD
jgi:hypothetical protein